VLNPRHEVNVPCLDKGDRLLRRTLFVAAGLLATLIPVGPAFAMRADPGPQAAPAAASACDVFRVKNPFRQVTVRNYSSSRIYTNSSLWALASCGQSSFTVPYGRRAYAVVRVGAESDCYGSGTNQWCQARVLVNHVEANPVGSEPDSFAFDSNNGGQFDWQAHSFARARPVLFGCSARSGCTYPVSLQYKVHASGLSLWIDEQTLEVDVTYV